MAKKSKVNYEAITGDKTINIDLSSKNLSYKITTENKVNIVLNIACNYSDYNKTEFYNRSGNNLIYTVIYLDRNSKNTPKNIVTTTFLDYYTRTAEDTFKVSVNNGSQTDIQNKDLYNVVSGKTSVIGADNKYLGSNKADIYTVKNGYNTIRDFKGNDTYRFQVFGSPDRTAYVYDYAGNDKYTLFGAPSTMFISDTYGGNTQATINDYKGNDTYTVSGASTLTANDFAGNDKYNINNATKDTTIKDYGGNDKYTVNNSKVTIEDTLGKDTYTLAGINGRSSLTDRKGNDKYNINSSDGTDGLISILDEDGKDIFNITGSKFIEITDEAGNDKYNVKNSDSISIIEQPTSEITNEIYNFTNVTNSVITDTIGVDTYKLNSTYDMTIYDNDKNTLSNPITSKQAKDNFIVKNSTLTKITSNFGDDKYTVSNNSSDIIVEDESGNETYNIKDTTFLKITDTLGDDKYNLTNVDNYHLYAVSTNTAEGGLDYNIKDNGGDDTYNIKNSNRIDIYDETLESDTKKKNTFNLTSSNNSTIYADKNSTSKSQNTYNIVSSKNVEINDYGTSDDKYTVKKLDKNTTLEINDEGGNDSLIISGAKKNDIVFMAYTKDNVNSDSLFMYDTKNGGYVNIDNYFTIADSKYTNTSTGVIETIKAGKKDVTDKIKTCEAYSKEGLVSEITSWFGSHTGYSSSIEQVLNSGNTEDIKSLVAIFNQTNNG